MRLLKCPGTNQAKCRRYPGRRDARRMVSSEAFTLSLRCSPVEGAVSAWAGHRNASEMASLGAVVRSTGLRHQRTLARAWSKQQPDGPYRAVRGGGLTTCSSGRLRSAALVRAGGSVRRSTRSVRPPPMRAHDAGEMRLLKCPGTNQAKCRRYPGRRDARRMVSSEAFTLSLRCSPVEGAVSAWVEHRNASEMASLGAVVRSTGLRHQRTLARAWSKQQPDGPYRAVRGGGLTTRSSGRSNGDASSGRHRAAAHAER